MKTKHGAEFADVRKFISDGQSFTLLTHISPDGDTLGSAPVSYTHLTLPTT